MSTEDRKTTSEPTDPFSNQISNEATPPQLATEKDEAETLPAVKEEEEQAKTFESLEVEEKKKEDVNVGVEEEKADVVQAGPPDGGLEAWFRVFGSFMMHFVVLGAVYSYGVFQRYYTANQTFPGTTTTQLALIGSLQTFLAFLVAPVTGALTLKLGNRITPALGSILFCISYIGASFATQYWTALLCQGALFGISSMLTWIPAVSMPSQWFSSRRGLAMGICVSGAGIGGLALGPLTQTLLDHVGVAWTLRIWGLAGGTACMLCSFTLKARVEPPGMWDVRGACFGRRKEVVVDGNDNGLPKKPAPPFIDFSPFKIFTFNLLFLICFFLLWGLNTPYAFMPTFATKVVGTTPATASVILGVANGCSSAGRILLGAACDKLGSLNVMVVTCFLVAGTVFAFWLPCSYGTVGLVFVYGVTYGFLAGSLLSMIPTVLASIVGISNFAGKMGLLYLSFAPGGLAAPPLAGLSYDTTQSYLPMQIMVAFAWVCAGLVSLVLRIILGRQADRKTAALKAEGSPSGKPEKWLGKVRVM